MGDSYKVKVLTEMLAHEENPDEDHYGAHLSHWDDHIRPLTIDAGGLRALLEYYSTHPTSFDD